MRYGNIKSVDFKFSALTENKLVHLIVTQCTPNAELKRIRGEEKKINNQFIESSNKNTEIRISITTIEIHHTFVI